MLAGTVAAAAVVAVGVPAVIPSSPSANAAPKLTPTAADASDANARRSTRCRRPRSAAVPRHRVGCPPRPRRTASSGTVDPFANGVNRARRSEAGPAAAPLGALVRPTTTTAVGARPPTRRPRRSATPAGGATPSPPTATRRRSSPSTRSPTLVAPADPAAGPAGHRCGRPSSTPRSSRGRPPPARTATGYDVFVGFAPGHGVPACPLNGATPVVGHLVPGDGADSRPDLLLHGPGPCAGRLVGALQRGVGHPLRLLHPGRPPDRPGHLDGVDRRRHRLLAGHRHRARVSAHGSATDLGSTATLALAAPIVQIVADPSGDGYWEVAADGGVFAYGAARFEGAASSLPLNSPIVDLVPTADGQGYWEVAADGGVFAYGDAGFARLARRTRADRRRRWAWPPTRPPAATGWSRPTAPSPRSTRRRSARRPDDLPSAPVVGIAATADGKGVWEVTRVRRRLRLRRRRASVARTRRSTRPRRSTASPPTAPTRRLLAGGRRRRRLRLRRRLLRRRLIRPAAPSPPMHGAGDHCRSPSPVPATVGSVDRDADHDRPIRTTGTTSPTPRHRVTPTRCRCWPRAEQRMALMVRNFDDPTQEWRRLCAELVGTFFLVLVAAGGPMIDHVHPGLGRPGRRGGGARPDGDGRSSCSWARCRAPTSTRRSARLLAAAGLPLAAGAGLRRGAVRRGPAGRLVPPGASSHVSAHYGSNYPAAGHTAASTPS